MGFKYQIVAALSVALACGQSLVLATSGDQSIEKLSQDAVRAYESGNFKDASKKLSEILNLKPTSQQALNLRKTIGFNKFLQMSQQEELQKVVANILTMAKIGESVALKDDESINAMIEALVIDYKHRWIRWSEDANPAVGAIEGLGQAGQFAIGPLFKALNAETIAANRAYYTRAIIAAGPNAVWPVIEISYSSNEMLANTAIFVLGEYKSVVAVPRLLELEQNGNQSERRIAGEALAKIRQYNDLGELNPIESYKNLIIDYLFGKRGLGAAIVSDGYVWALDDAGELVSKRVPQMAYKNILAEKIVKRAMSGHLESGYSALLLIAKLSQLQEAQDFLSVKDDKLFSGNQDLADELTEFYTKQLESLKYVNSLLRASGENILKEALFTTLKYKRINLSSAILEALTDVSNTDLVCQNGKDDKISKVVLEALNYPDLRISARAAIALLSTGYEDNFSGIDKMSSLIMQAVNSKDVELLKVLCVGVLRSKLVGEFDFKTLLLPFSNLVSDNKMPTDLRISAIKVLETIGGDSWVSNLILVASNKDNNVKLRLASLKALGKFNCLNIGAKLLPLLQEDNDDIRCATGIVVGRSVLSKQKRELIFISNTNE